MEAETVVDAMKRFEDGWEDDYQVRPVPPAVSRRCFHIKPAPRAHLS